jgi:nitrite reductase/ring-hydroxylating ferredoxin subunit
LSAQWVKVCDIGDLEPESHAQMQVAGLGAIALYHVEGQFYATADQCTHMKASLGEEGALEGHVIQCTWHNGKYDIRTGEVLAKPCPLPLKTYCIEVREGAVYIDIQSP